MSTTMHTTEYIPADWLERAAWAAHCGQRLTVYSRPIQIERRHGERRTSNGRTTGEPVEAFHSLQLEELALV